MGEPNNLYPSEIVTNLIENRKIYSLEINEKILSYFKTFEEL